jgi:hypothetical protein
VVVYGFKPARASAENDESDESDESDDGGKQL